MVATTIAGLRDRVGKWRRTGQRIVLVPTMGNLHAGHLQLVEQARQHGERIVVSIFVNPLQFGPDEDFARYPRTLEQDLDLLAGVGADAVFHPTVEQMYPDGGSLQTSVRVPGLEGVLCGPHRSGHFAGVATVVTKLLLIAQPDSAVFGRKDYQQLTLIRQLVRDLCLPVSIEDVRTVREPDGLAMSSRNRYLTADQRARANTLYTQLCAVRDAVRGGSREFTALCAAATQHLLQAGFVPDYINVIDAGNLRPPTAATQHMVVAGAAALGRARLIDNVQV